MCTGMHVYVQCSHLEKPPQSQYFHRLAFPQSTNRAVNPHFMLRNLRHKSAIAPSLML
jgi:hypothetical protein